MKFIRNKRKRLSKKDEKEIRRHLEALGYLEKEDKSAERVDHKDKRANK